MIKLIRANLARVYKLIIVALALYAVYSIVMPLILYALLEEKQGVTEMILTFNYGASIVPIQGILILLICPLMYCSEFQNQAIKNKIIVGHKKCQIYVANFLTTGIIALAMNAVYLLFFLMIGLPLFGMATASANEIIMLIIDGTLMSLAYSAIFTFVSMTSKNSVAALIISIVMIIFGVVIACICDEVVNVEPYWIDGSINEFGEYVEVKVYNPNMPSQATQNFCQFILDFLPSGQSFQLANNLTARWQMALCSLGMIGATTGAGTLIFNKTNIK